MARANLDSLPARIGLTDQIPLPNKGFPSGFLALQHPHKWAGMNANQQLTLADNLPELLAKLRPDENDRRTVESCTWTRIRRR